MPCGVHSKSDPALDVRHPFDDFQFRRVPSSARHEDLIIHQLKYPHDDADFDINVIFPVERLQELAAEGVLGGLTGNFFSFIGYHMDPERFERTVTHGIAEAVARVYPRSRLQLLEMRRKRSKRRAQFFYCGPWAITLECRFIAIGKGVCC